MHWLWTQAYRKPQRIQRQQPRPDSTTVEDTRCTATISCAAVIRRSPLRPLGSHTTNTNRPRIASPLTSSTKLPRDQTSSQSRCLAKFVVAVSRAREPNIPQQHLSTTRLPPINATRLNLRFPTCSRHMETQHPLVPLPRATRKHELPRSLQRPLLSQPTFRSHAKQRSHRKTQNAHRRALQSPHRR
jgi:hypothetical protein